MHNKKGTILITVTCLSYVALIIAVAVSAIVSQDTHMVRRLKRNTQAQYLAEAGLNDALVVLKNQGFSAKDTSSNFPLTSLGAGTYDVTVIQSGGRVLLSSEGVVQGVSRTASVEVKSLYPEALEYSLATGGDIEITSVQGNVTINGDIHANGNMDLVEQGPSTTFWIKAYGGDTGKATCSGSSYSATDVIIDDSANSGPNEPLITTPNFDFGSYQTVAQTEGAYYSSSQTFNGASLTGGSAGLTYVNGDATFSNSNTITGGFVASGDITLNNGNSIVQTQDGGNRFPIFMCGDTAKLYGLFSTEEGNIVYATDNIKIRTTGGTTAVLGAVIAGGDMEVVANNNISMTYFKVLASEVVSEGVEIVSWNR